MSGMDVLRERIADAVRAHRPGTSINAYRCVCGELWTSQHVADAVIAALWLREMVDGEGHYWQTPWERIEEDA